MVEIEPAPVDPRWGQEGRDRKAEAILATLRLHCHQNLDAGIWLDIGCGSGGIAATLAVHVERVVGIDPEPWARWEDFRKRHPNLVFHVGSYRDIDAFVGAESCMVVICNQVYEHVDAPLSLLATIYRVLKPGGICYFAGPNFVWPIEPHVFWPFVHWLPRGFAQRAMRALGSKHAHELDAWSWPYWKLVRAFRQTGFEYQRAIGDRIHAQAALGHSITLRMMSYVPRVVLSSLAPVAPGFIFVLRKPGASGT